MAQANKGDTVQVHYTGTLEDGTVFDTSVEREPLSFKLGDGMVIAGFEKAVLGMNEGETKSVDIAPEEGYGEYHEEMTISVPKRQLPPNIEPEVGMMLQVRTEDGGAQHVVIKEITDEDLVLDGNHPLAGKKLNFELTLVKVG